MNEGNEVFEQVHFGSRHFQTNSNRGKIGHWKLGTRALANCHPLCNSRKSRPISCFTSVSSETWVTSSEKRWQHQPQSGLRDTQTHKVFCRSLCPRLVICQRTTVLLKPQPHLGSKSLDGHAWHS